MTSSFPAKAAVARVQIDLVCVPANERLDIWRGALEPVFEIAPDPTATAPFSGVVAMAHLGDALISTVCSGPQIFDRNQSHARRTGLDHFMVQTFVRGAHQGAYRESEVRRGRGDVWIIDLAQASKSHASSFANVTLIIPRDRVLPLLKGGDPHGTTLRAGSASARLIASHLDAMFAASTDLDLTEAASAVDAAALMIAGAWSRIRDSHAQVTAAVRATARRAVCDYIDRHLTNPQLSPEMLLRVFHMSRATLYRLFEDDGGIAAYILGRRLDRCHAMIASSTSGNPSIGQIAYRHGFASDAHFSRAFRRRFGIAPREARGKGRGVADAPSRADAQAISDWLITLRRQHLRLVAE